MTQTLFHARASLKKHAWELLYSKAWDAIQALHIENEALKEMKLLFIFNMIFPFIAPFKKI